MKKRILQNRLYLAIVVTAIWLLPGCESAYYKTMETMGYHKRDIMVDRVSEARDAQEEAKEQFESALEKFSKVLGFKGGSLQEKYDQLKDEYEKSDTKAAAVSSRIAAVEDVAEDLFAERDAEEKVWGSMVKQAIKRRKPGFNESYYGFKTFGNLLEEARERKLLDLEFDAKSGGYIITRIAAG